MYADAWYIKIGRKSVHIKYKNCLLRLCTYLSKSEGRKSPLPENTSGINTTATGVKHDAQKSDNYMTFVAQLWPAYSWEPLWHISRVSRREIWNDGYFVNFISSQSYGKEIRVKERKRKKKTIEEREKQRKRFMMAKMQYEASLWRSFVKLTKWRFFYLN